jgi:membrane protease YdiL (CAAX protease family)
MDNGIDTPRVHHCGRCGTPLRRAARFCAQCGARAWEAPQDPQLPQDSRDSANPVPPMPDRRRELLTAGWLYGLLMLTSLFFGIAYHVEPDADLMVWATASYAVLILGFAAGFRAETVALLRPSAFDRNAGRKLAIAGAVQFVVLGIVFYLLEKTGIPFERITDEMERHDYSLWQLLALCSLAPAFIEEIAFRGIIFARLRNVLGEREAWLVQAALFSILHLSPVIFPTHFAMGLIFGWLRMRTGSLLPGMVLHAAWNAAVILLELYH